MIAISYGAHLPWPVRARKGADAWNGGLISLPEVCQILQLSGYRLVPREISDAFEALRHLLLDFGDERFWPFHEELRAYTLEKEIGPDLMPEYEARLADFTLAAWQEPSMPGTQPASNTGSSNQAWPTDSTLRPHLAYQNYGHRARTYHDHSHDAEIVPRSIWPRRSIHWP